MILRTEPLYRVQLLLLASEAQDAALVLAQFGAFNPAPCTLDALADSPAVAYRDVWLEARARLDKLLSQCGDAAPLVVPAGAEAPSLADLQELNDWLKAVWSACLACHESEGRIAEANGRLDALTDTLTKLERLDVDVARLLRPDSLLAFEIGSLPAAGFRRLAEALTLSGHIVARFDQAGDQVYAVVAGPRTRHDDVRGLLQQAGWHGLDVPDALRAHPQAARAWLEAERARLATETGATCQVRDGLRSRYGPRLQEARLRLALAAPLAEAAGEGVRGRGALALLTGWVPQKQAAALRTALDARFHGRYWLDLRAPAAEESGTVPTLMRHPAWLAPFAPLTTGYGVPRYGEFDPTLPFVLAWLLMFGAMFGDVGHGAAILLLAAFLHRRLGRLAWIGVAAGTASMGFGLVYGSVFGYETLIAPLWLSPLHDPGRVLAIALGFGVAYIVFTLAMSLYNRWAAGRHAAALFDSAGLAGMVFYLGAVGWLASLAGVADVSVPAGAIAAAGLAVIAVYTWLQTRAALGERVLVTLIETLETGISLFSNTLSFLRVAAFSLNHVALALAVFTLAQSLGSLGHGLAVVAGNLVIIVLEGSIVAIQALRLMYFEGFTRFFSGDGRAFAPLRVGNA